MMTMTPQLALSSGTVAAIVVIALVDLFAIFFGLSFARSRRNQRQAEAAATASILGEPAPPVPRPVSRREFFRRSRCWSSRPNSGARPSRSCGRTCAADSVR
jgi:hypothetical protein